jgi:hypothetical protein
MRVVGFKTDVIAVILAGNAAALPSNARGTPSARELRAKAGGNLLATPFSSRTITARNAKQNKGKPA